MTNIIDKLMHRHNHHQRPQADEIEDRLAPEASPEKLAEAEAWTARKRAETEATKREFARYELELQLETGVISRHINKDGMGGRPQP